MRRGFVLFLILAVAIPAMMFAQSSGKIAGIVTDKSTGEPLPGVNILVEGTEFGAATDVDGYYAILNLPVGTYTLRATYLGYKDVVVKNVRVSADVTTNINFQMEPTTLELEEAVVVTAERPLVDKNVTQSVSFVSSQQIETLPVRGLNDILALQNSVVVQDGQVHIRGGRDDEVGYYLDGSSVVNPLNNNPVVHIIQEAIEEIQVLAGGYTAEFGGANSGIIRTEMRTGTPEYHLSLDFQTDKFVNEGDEFLGTPTFRHHYGVATLSGPVPGTNKRVRFFAAVENRSLGDRIRRFSKGFEFINTPKDDPNFDPLNGRLELIDENPSNPNVSAGHPDTLQRISYPDGFTPHNKENLTSINGTLLFDYSPIRFRVSGAFDDRRRYVDNSPILNILNNRNGYFDFTNALLSGKLTYVVSPKTLAELNVNYLFSESESKDDLFGADWTKWRDSAAVAQATGGRVQYRSRWDEPYDYIIHGFTFARDGAHPFNRYTHTKMSQIGANLSIVSQFNRFNEVKIGGEIKRYTYREFGISHTVMRQVSTYGSIKDVPLDTWMSEGLVRNIGFDPYGNEVDNTDESKLTLGPRHPTFIGAYIQDKIELADIIINAGLRFDYFDTEDRRLKDPKNVKSVNGRIAPDQWENVDPFTELSPRLGVSFPVSEKTVFYFQYGKFVQMPELNTIYRGLQEFDDQIIRGGRFFLNPVGFGLEPVRTTSYEIGFRQQFSRYAAFDIVGFYRNVKGQVQVDKVTDAAPGTQQYLRLVNGDFATTKGAEFRLTLRRVQRLQAQFNYTYTDAKGTGSTRTSFIGAAERETQKPTIIRPLDFSQEHTGAINLDYRFGRNDGGPILQRLGVNVLFTFSSGHPYTRVFPLPGGQVDPFTAGTDYMLDTRTRKALEPVNSSRTPWIFNVDLRVDKTFTIQGFADVTLYSRVTNLFNNKNVINVYEATGSADDDGFLSDRSRSQATIDAFGGDQYIAMYRAINLENGQAYWTQLGRQLYGHPRQILFGIKINY
ncbi:MAG: hypothetical protein D6715_04850 [Calditrichaeota bacterium]|nr:MAG: hypothetical protein D6715_04850 [Calditrichota bacterium]